MQVMAFDQHGGSIKATRKSLGLVYVEIYDAQKNDEYAMIFDPKDPEDLNWLKNVYQPIHLEVLLGEA